MKNSVKIASAVMAGVVCAAQIAVAGESGSFDVIESAVHDYTVMEHAGTTITSGPLHGTATIVRSSGGPSRRAVITTPRAWSTGRNPLPAWTLRRPASLPTQRATNGTCWPKEAQAIPLSAAAARATNALSAAPASTPASPETAHMRPDISRTNGSSRPRPAPGKNRDPLSAARDAGCRDAETASGSRTREAHGATRGEPVQTLRSWPPGNPVGRRFLRAARKLIAEAVRRHVGFG